MEHTPLGKPTAYVSVYTPSLLCPIARQQSRAGLGIGDELPFAGTDIWTAYELSWLNKQGKPQVAIGRFQFPCTTPNLVESKSFKLYLNSYNQTHFHTLDEVVTTLESDLSVAAGGPVWVEVLPLSSASKLPFGHLPGDCLDQQAISITDYSPNAAYLQLSSTAVEVRESLYTDLFKSNCPVTGQPDWASVWLDYRGPAIDRAGLLQYLVSFREHQDFHENCVERIFMDVMARCKPAELSVYARYTRRGGLDINPFRTNTQENPLLLRLVRQ